RYRAGLHDGAGSAGAPAAISAINSLTLSPALAALLLRGHDTPPDALQRVINFLFGWFFRGFNWVFARGSRGYGGGVRGTLKVKSLVMVFYAVMLGATWWLFQAVPPGFVPAQDKQYLVGFAQLPDGATLDRTEEVIRQMTEITLAQPGVSSAVAFPGLSIAGFSNSSNAGIVFSVLDPFEERTSPELSAGAIAGALNQKYGVIKGAFIAMFPPPPVQGLGVVGGFKMQIEDRAGRGYEALNEVTNAFMAKAMAAPELTGQFTTYQINVPQIFTNVDRTKARQLGVPISSVFETLQVYLGSLYVNDFNKFGRTYSVRAQADAPFRARPEDIGKLKVRSLSGEMIPLSALLTVETTAGPERAQRYNGFLTADFNASPAPGYSSGKAQE
ncbi:MAG: multidrug efflux RND transporter permease subunit, partial [Starkeya sp.]|nr:multidrug efflux RND transporter permease subunit [Starkeya sp.]